MVGRGRYTIVPSIPSFDIKLMRCFIRLVSSTWLVHLLVDIQGSKGRSWGEHSRVHPSRRNRGSLLGLICGCPGSPNRRGSDGGRRSRQSNRHADFSVLQAWLILIINGFHSRLSRSQSLAHFVFLCVMIIVPTIRLFPGSLGNRLWLRASRTL